MADLLAIAPMHPDFSFCDAFYSSGTLGRINAADCIAAEHQMPRGDAPVTWLSSRLDEENVHPFEIPKIYLEGTCEIRVESVHPRLHEAEAAYEIAPNEFREMAGWVIRNCLQGASGEGGFITKNISNVDNYLSTPNANLFPEAYPRSATFFVVTVTGFRMDDQFMAGHSDPTVGGAIYDSLYARLVNLAFGDANWNQLANVAEYIAHAWSLMQRRSVDDGGGYHWYGESTANPPEQTTTFQCDSNLGNPQHADCSQLQYSQLETPSDSISLQAGEARFLHAGTCSIGISVSAPSVLSWDQINAALNDLIEICVNNPLAKAVGGRAYYGAQEQVLYNIGGQRRRKRNTVSNALPPHVNITLFQQYEIYPSFPKAAEEMQSCTWQKVTTRQDVRPCQNIHHHQTRPPTAENPRSGDPCVANSDCGFPSESICALNDGIALDGSGPSNFSCVSVRDATTALGTDIAEIHRCVGRCLSAGDGANGTLATPPSSTTATSALLPLDVVCPCNCTYVSHDCCLSKTRFVSAELSQKLNISVQAPNSTVCCNATTGQWATAPVQRDNLTLNTLCPDYPITSLGAGYINF